MGTPSKGPGPLSGPRGPYPPNPPPSRPADEPAVTPEQLSALASILRDLATNQQDAADVLSALGDGDDGQQVRNHATDIYARIEAAFPAPK